jgi:hypothetical protein
MGASSSVLSDKIVLVTYDNSSKDPLIQGLYNEIYKLPIKLYYNDLSKLEDCDIIINIVSKGTIKDIKQLNTINNGIKKMSVFIFTDRHVSLNSISSLSENDKSICISYLDYNNFQSIMQIIIAKITEN